MMQELYCGTKMFALARSFPCLRLRADNALSIGLAPWDPQKLAIAASAWSAGERLAVSFILTVWDADQEIFERFNVIEAVKKWDVEHWNAFLNWAEDPIHF